MAAGDLWVCGATPDQIYQRINGVWQTGIAGPSGQTFLSGIAFDAAGDLWVCGGNPGRGLPSVSTASGQTGIAGPSGQTFAIRT